MRANALLSQLLAVALTLCLSNVQAQSASVQELERNLKERDRVISELLDRVEALERRIGVARQLGSAAASSKQDHAPGIKDHVATGRSAPGIVVVDESLAERALERSLTRAGALLLPPGIVELEPAVSYVRREADAPRFVSSAGQLLLGKDSVEASTTTADLALRLGLPADSQLELGIPYRWRKIDAVTSVGLAPMDSSHQSASGLGDIRVGLAKTLLREGAGRPDLVGRVTWDTNSGKRLGNGITLGSGFHEISGSLTAVKRQDPLVFVAGIGYQHAFENDNLKPGRTVSANIGSFLAISPETSLQLGIYGAHQKEVELAGQRISGSDQTIGTFIVGGSTLLARGMLLNLSLGIGLTNDSDDLSIAVSLPIRFGKSIF